MIFVTHSRIWVLIVESSEGKTIALLPWYLQTTTSVGWEGEKNLGKWICSRSEEAWIVSKGWNILYIIITPFKKLELHNSIGIMRLFLERSSSWMQKKLFWMPKRRFVARESWTRKRKKKSFLTRKWSLMQKEIIRSVGNYIQVIGVS